MLEKTRVKLLCGWYGRTQHVGFRRYLIRRIAALEGSQRLSASLRELFKKHHLVDVGLYSEGGCFDPRYIDPHTTFGRYCSIGMNVRIINANHPMNFKSMHVFFYNSKLKLCDEDLISHIPLRIGNDVWMGDHCIVMPNVNEIGDGAVIGAGAVVSKNVPPYAVVVGNPARVVRYRFSKPVIDRLCQEQWWRKTIEEIIPDIGAFQKPFEEEAGGEDREA